jgi:hypothetical protein
MKFGEQMKKEKEKDYFDEFLFVMRRLQKKYIFEYNGVKFVSNKEIVGVEPETFKLIYKNNN